MRPKEPNVVMQGEVEQEVERQVQEDEHPGHEPLSSRDPPGEVAQAARQTGGQDQQGDRQGLRLPGEPQPVPRAVIAQGLRAGGGDLDGPFGRFHVKTCR